MLEFLLGACFFLCLFAPFTFVIFLIDAIKKVVSGEGNEYLSGLGAGLSLLIILGGSSICCCESSWLALLSFEC